MNHVHNHHYKDSPRNKLEKHFAKLISPFENFIHNQMTASLLLLICTFIALILASSPFTSRHFFSLISTEFGFQIGKTELTESVQFWINDILLALFFFTIGLEIKKEFLIGELSNPRKIALVLATALGGMVVPAAIYYYITKDTLFSHAWGIPMATDTAFCLGILALFRHKIPKGLITFMIAVAIFDDIGAITVIATVYTSHFIPTYFVMTLGLAALLCVINLAGIRAPLPYILIGIGVWITTELSGVHGTLAGLLVAFTVPARADSSKQNILKNTEALLEKLNHGNKSVLEDDEQHQVLQEINSLTLHGMTPLQHWGSALDKPVNMLILPLFALTNAGVTINFEMISKSLHSPIVLGIAAGLLLGKFLGITLSCVLSNRLAKFPYPKGVHNYHIIGMGLLAGIGFTMSIFIADLSFTKLFEPLMFAKSGILLASFTAGLLAIVWFKFIPASEEPNHSN